MDAPTLDQIKLMLVPYEGNIEHMYLDSKGLVTVGIGNLLPNAGAAQALGFIDRLTTNSATKEAIAVDFSSVAKQKVGRRARDYREFTKLDLPSPLIDNLFRKRVDEFLASLRKAYPKFDDYPTSVQLAMLDMAFNMGTAGLKTGWPKLNTAIDAEDWAEAAKNCVRPGANPIRNAGTVARFQAAAEATP